MIMRVIPKNEQKLRIKMVERYGYPSFQKLADEINAQLKSSDHISRQAVDQVVRGTMKTPWIRMAIAEILGASPETFWPDFNQN